MRIEFSNLGTNVEVCLIDDVGVVDRVYTADHQGGLHYDEVPISARNLFNWVEESWYPPIIGGKYAGFHPYWHERAEKRRQRNGS
jgi:hypothetical protein